MSPIKQEQKKIKQILKEDFKIILTKSKFDEYLYLFSKFNPLKKTTTADAVFDIAENPNQFAYFIFGTRAKEENRLNLYKNH